MPANVRLVDFVPLHSIVPTCAVVIHHGAFGTVNTTALAGVPQLATPERHDTPFYAGRPAEFGAGLSIPFREVTGAGVRDALVRLLTEPSFAAWATARRDEMRSSPTPAQPVPHLERLVGAHG